MPIAPSGAVTIIASTATESTICPQASPAAKGTEPMAACTVALGRYAMTQKMRSFHVRFVFMVQKSTPAALKTRAARIMSKAGSPALSV